MMEAAMTMMNEAQRNILKDIGEHARSLNRSIRELGHTGIPIEILVHDVNMPEVWSGKKLEKLNFTTHNIRAFVRGEVT